MDDLKEMDDADRHGKWPVCLHRCAGLYTQTKLTAVKFLFSGWRYAIALVWVVLKAGMPECRNAGNQDPEILKPGMTNIFQACR